MSNETLVQIGAADAADNKKRSPARTMAGKIARLPNAIREKANRRLGNGERASAILPWLNALPVVKRVLAGYFGGAAITDRNLSSWRRTGYKRWLEKQEFVAELKALSEEATDFSRAAGEKLARGTASIAAAKILKMLHAIRPEDCTPTELIKIAFATTALVQAEQNNERLKNEKTRIGQRDEQVTLAWDKHLRDCAAIGLRLLDDAQAKAVQKAPIDNSEKIELIGRRMFGKLWRARKVMTKFHRAPIRHCQAINETFEKSTKEPRLQAISTHTSLCR